MQKANKKGRKIMTVSIPGEIYSDFIELCTKNNYNRSAIVAEMILRFVQRNRKK